ncbi:MAG: hypothetical protein JWQ69_652, partial [Pseudomonas sp.]|nr:hypothetical protein [Pseudomonas sp.]
AAVQAMEAEPELEFMGMLSGLITAGVFTACDLIA